MLFLRRGILFSLLFSIAAALPLQAALTADEHQKRLQIIEHLLRQDLAKFEQTRAATPTKVSTRDIPHAALFYLMVGEGPDKGVAKAEGLLRLFFKDQNMDPKSPDFGTVLWVQDRPELRDGNAIEFSCEPIGPLFHLYADRFPKAFLAEAEPHLRAALVGIAHHKVALTYTNIALMKLVNQILIGEYLQDKNAVATGKATLDAWIDLTRHNGLCEFDSPVYTQTQICVVYNLYHNVQDPVVKAKAKVILDYYWVDLAANFFPGSESLAAPYSRTYDFLTHNDNVSQVYWLNDIPARFPPTDGLLLNDICQIWFSATWNDYTPPDSTLALAAEPTRLILQKFGTLPGQDRTCFITPEFAIGSASHEYGAQSRLVSTCLSSTNDLPWISVLPDELDAPYGKIKTQDKGGHTKPHVVAAPISAVQDKDAVLTLLDLAPPVRKTPVTSLATDVILPLQVDALVVDGKPVDWGASGVVPITADSVIGVRNGNGAVAIRLFTAEASPGSTPTFCLKNDGKEWNAGRIVAYQYQGPATTLTAKSLHSGVLLLAAHCASDAEFTAFLARAKAWSLTPSVDGTVWKVTASGPSAAEGTTTLEASLDSSTQVTGPRLVNGQPYVSPTLTVNGDDWSGKVWSELP